MLRCVEILFQIPINGNKKQIDPNTSECAQNTQKDKFPYKCKAHVAY